jgi:predicted small integral membrane protein
MKEALVLILIIVAAFALIGGLSMLYQRRFNLKRNALMPRVTKRSRAIAIVSALIFGLIYFVEITFFEQFHSIFLLIAVIALIYSFRKPQDENVDD